MTVYREVVGYPGYHVGDDGSVWSQWQKGNRFGWPKIVSRWVRLKEANRSGYRQVKLTGPHGKRTFKIHRLVLTAFRGPCPEGMEACHDNGNPADNRLSNLRWDTKQGNSADMLRHGTTPRGEKNGKTKLSEEEVRTIRWMWQSEGLTLREIAEFMEVPKATVRGIVTARTWGHLKLYDGR